MRPPSAAVSHTPYCLWCFLALLTCDQLEETKVICYLCDLHLLMNA